MKYKVDPKLDPSKVDIHNDFGNYPKLFKTPNDIGIFIRERDCDFPVLKNLLNLRDLNRLNLTPTESEFLFDEFFDYIYDVYTIPIEQTFIDAEKFLEYLELTLVEGGLISMMNNAYEKVSSRFETSNYIRNSLKEIGVKRKKPKVINRHKNIGNVKYPEAYNSTQKSIKEQFWIKSSRRAGQPVNVGEEAYMRVWVYNDRVYIFGCDDCSYTLTGNKQELKDFVFKLKVAAPVWNFSFPKYIHPKLEFTN